MMRFTTVFFFSSRRRHTRFDCDWSSDVCSSDLVNTINFEDPEKVRHKVNFDNLTPLYPDERLRLELPDPTVKDKSARVMDLVEIGRASCRERVEISVVAGS